MEVTADDAAVDVSDLSDPIVVTTELPAFASVDAFSCGYMDNSTGTPRWRTEGVVTLGMGATGAGVGATQTVKCATTHLTAFAVVDTEPTEGAPASPVVAAVADLLLSVTPSGTVFLACLVLIIVGFMGVWIAAAVVTRVRHATLLAHRERIYLAKGVIGRHVELPASDRITARTVMDTVVSAFGKRIRNEHSWLGLITVRLRRAPLL